MVKGKRIGKFVQRVREERTKGKVPRVAAFIRVGAKRKREMVGAKGKPFLEMPQKEALRRVKERALPRLKRISRPKGEKRRLLHALFSERGARLGLVLVKPAILSKSWSVKSFLGELGCELVYSKPIMLTKEHLAHVYPHAIKVHKYFAMHALDLLSGPSRVIIFKHVPEAQYVEQSRFLKHLQKTNQGEFRKLLEHLEKTKSSQNVFNMLFKGSFEREDPGTLRGDIVYPSLREMGFGKKTVMGLAAEIDALGFYQHQLATDPHFRVAFTMTGLHVPSSHELLRDANAFLSTEDLKAIRKRLKG